MGTGADLELLARIAGKVASEWGLELGPPFALCNYSYVAPAGGHAVLKVTSAEDDESDEEADALELWNGDGAVRLLRRDRARRALLLERARPGSDISQLPEDEATAIRTTCRRFSGTRSPTRWSSTLPSGGWRRSLLRGSTRGACVPGQ